MSVRDNSSPRVQIGPLAERPAHPRFDGLFYVSPTLISAYDALSGLWVDAGGGGGVIGSNTLVFTDGPADEANGIFNDWSRLYTKYITLPALQQKSIVFAPLVSGVPLHIPATGMPFGGWVIGKGNRLVGQGFTFWSGVEIDAGAALVDVTYLTNGLALSSNSASPSLVYSTFGVGDDINLVIDTNTTIQNNGTAPMIEWDRSSATNSFVIRLLPGARMNVGTAPVIDESPSGAFLSLMFFFVYDGTISPGTISGSDSNGGTAEIDFRVFDGQVSLNQPGWTAAEPLASIAAFKSQDRPRVNIQTLPVSVNYALNNGSEFVRVAPLAAPIQITLPPAAQHPGETALVKKTNGNIVQVVTVVSAGGAIDTFGSDVWPTGVGTGFTMRRYTSDGTDWWITTE